jgi:hypothetical protein
VFSYYNFNYGLRLSRYIGSRHFSPEEQKPIYRPVALKGLIRYELIRHEFNVDEKFMEFCRIFYEQSD